MNGLHGNGRNCGFEKTYPGCLGRMASLIELNVGVSTNRLLHDKPHQNGSPLSRSRSDGSRVSPSVDPNPIQKGVILPELNRSVIDGKSNGTPMKMLISQEMSKEVDLRRDPPNLVAKLMGLDAFPQQEPECEDACEIWQQSQNSPHVARYENTVDAKMALVRQKFIEAKRLSINEEHHQSKQFKDALEVLSSNRDLFLKCSREPDSLFSENDYNRHSVPRSSVTKRITILRPSKMAASDDSAKARDKDGIPKKKALFQVSGLRKVHPGSSPPASSEYDENSTYPTRIVVLKPSPLKARDVKAMGSLYSKLPRMLDTEDLFGDVRHVENQESREVAKAITQKVREKLGGHCRDETLISSILSNGYLGDESSFNKSEHEYADDNLSDSEATSPVSRSSWDYVRRLSAYSSSLTWASESLVCREAKKRLFVRWTMMAANGVCQEQKRSKKSSSTLGEMLAFPETKAAFSHADEGCSCQESKDSDALLVDGQRRAENMDNSPRNLLRSKSLPVSTTESGTSLNVSMSILDKSESLKDMEARNTKSAFKGKISSLFFSRNKRPGNDKSLVSDVKDEFYLSPGESYTIGTEILNDKGSTDASPYFEPSSKASSSNRVCKQGLLSPETELFVEKPIAFVNPGENQDHPSPVSVLDPLCEVDEHIERVFPHRLKVDQQRVESPLNSVESHLIDKSPPIGSIARGLSRDDSCVYTALSHPPKKSFTSEETEELEQEWFIFVKELLSVAGLHGEVQSNSFSERWYSLESPLDPSLMDKYIAFKHRNTLHDSKQRQTKVDQKLVFDCVNEALTEIAGYGSHIGQRAIPCIGTNDLILNNSTSSTMLDEVWAQMKVLFSGELDDCTDDSLVVVERVVRKEVAEMGSSSKLRVEVVILGKAIERRLLEELVLEVVVELAGTMQ